MLYVHRFRAVELYSLVCLVCGEGKNNQIHTVRQTTDVDLLNLVRDGFNAKSIEACKYELYAHELATRYIKLLGED